MKGKIQGIIGLIIIGFLLYGGIKGIYSRNFAEPEFTVIKSTTISSPIKNALFWHEEDLEKRATVMMGAKLSAEDIDYITPLYENLKKTGMVGKHIKTMSDEATKKMIELDAYRGTEPNVWEIAKENGDQYLFKIVIKNAEGKRKTSDLESVTYRYSLYDVAKETLIWEAESPRRAGFFGGMPDPEKSIETLKKHLKEAKIIE